LLRYPQKERGLVVTQEQLPAFFSYSRSDSDFALRLACDLKAAGASVWLDQLDINPGERWDRAVEDALTRCPRMLIILSPASVDSTNVMDEVSFALEEQKAVIPIIYQDCQVPFRLRRVQHVDFRQDYAHALKELLKTLAPAQIVEEQVTPTFEARDHHQLHSSDAGLHQGTAEQERPNGEQVRLGAEIMQRLQPVPIKQGRTMEHEHGESLDSRALNTVPSEEAWKQSEQREPKQSAEEVAKSSFLSKSPLWARIAVPVAAILIAGFVFYKVGLNSSEKTATEYKAFQQRPTDSPPIHETTTGSPKPLQQAQAAVAGNSVKPVGIQQRDLWLRGPLYGHDGEGEALRQVTIKAVADGYTVFIKNQMGYFCNLYFDDAGYPSKLTHCIAKVEPAWSMDREQVDLQCSTNAKEVICSGNYTDKNGNGITSIPSVLEIARKRQNGE
jgi:hypothetical protein